MLHAGKSDRRKRKRRFDLLTQDRCRKAAVGDVHQDALAQLDVLEVGAVGPERLLAVGAAVDIVEKSAWNPAAVQHTQVLDAGNGFHRWHFWGSMLENSGSTVPAGREMGAFGTAITVETVNRIR